MTDAPAREKGLLDQVFRQESARVVATLMRILGDLDLAEEILQETLVVAMERWPFAGVPDNPGAWLTTVARNRALDLLRRQRRFEAKLKIIAHEAEIGTQDHAEDRAEPEVIEDDRLRLIFTCCHPALAPESRVALTLKLVGALSTPEIARAFLTSEATIAQRIVRAKRTIRDRKLPYAVPQPAELPERLAPVLSVIYLIFNEGYAARAGSSLIRADLGAEAIRLATMLAELMPSEPEVLGLLALMELQASRNRARVDAAGNLVLLADQDRAQWDRELIRRGTGHLAAAEKLGGAGAYRLQAAIAACHALAPAWPDTDWRRIAALYAELQSVAPSPIVELNRAVAVSMVDGPAAGLAILDAIRDAPSLREYHLFPATRADFLRRLGQWRQAAADYRRAIAMAHNEREREFLTRRLTECEAREDDAPRGG
jgi:RNA polymerase sigma-70 factor (ECF subfamily)